MEAAVGASSPVGALRRDEEGSLLWLSVPAGSGSAWPEGGQEAPASGFVVGKFPNQSKKKTAQGKEKTVCSVPAVREFCKGDSTQFTGSLVSVAFRGGRHKQVTAPYITGYM